MCKNTTGLPSSLIGPRLYNACNDTVQYSLTNSHLTFFDIDESAMLKAIEKKVTKSVNPAVHWMNLGNLMQSEVESTKGFLMRICSLTVDCEFSFPACKTDLSSINIKDQFIYRLHNETIQTDVLAKATQLKTIDDLVKNTETFEMALYDHSQLHRSAEVHAAYASILCNHCQQQQQQRQACSGCGRNTHGITDTPPCHSHCPAWGNSVKHPRSPTILLLCAASPQPQSVV